MMLTKRRFYYRPRKKKRKETKLGLSFHVVIFPLLIITYAVCVSCYFYCLFSVDILRMGHCPHVMGRPWWIFKHPTQSHWCDCSVFTTTHQLWMTWKSIFRLFLWVNSASWKKKQLRSSMGIRERKSRVGVVFWCLRGGTFATQCHFHGRPTTSRWPRLCVDIFRCNRKNSFRCSSNDFYGLHSSCLFFPPSHTTFYFVFGCFSLLWTTKYIGSCLPANINFSTLAAVSSSNSI